MAKMEGRTITTHSTLTGGHLTIMLDPSGNVGGICFGEDPLAVSHSPQARQSAHESSCELTSRAQSYLLYSIAVHKARGREHIID